MAVHYDVLSFIFVPPLCSQPYTISFAVGKNLIRKVAEAAKAPATVESELGRLIFS